MLDEAIHHNIKEHLHFESSVCYIVQRDSFIMYVCAIIKPHLKKREMFAKIKSDNLKTKSSYFLLSVCSGLCIDIKMCNPK